MDIEKYIIEISITLFINVLTSVCLLILYNKLNIKNTTKQNIFEAICFSFVICDIVWKLVVINTFNTWDNKYYIVIIASICYVFIVFYDIILTKLYHMGHTQKNGIIQLMLFYNNQITADYVIIESFTEDNGHVSQYSKLRDYLKWTRLNTSILVCIFMLVTASRNCLIWMNPSDTIFKINVAEHIFNGVMLSFILLSNYMGRTKYYIIIFISYIIISILSILPTLLQLSNNIIINNIVANLCINVIINIVYYAYISLWIIKLLKDKIETNIYTMVAIIIIPMLYIGSTIGIIL